MDMSVMWQKFAELILTSIDYSSEKVNLTYGDWEKKLNLSIAEQQTAEKINDGWYDLEKTKKSAKAITYKYYNENTEWKLFAFKVEHTQLEDFVGEKNYSTIKIKFGFQRNSHYYTMTLIVPIMVLTLLAPIGLIIPGIFSVFYFYQLTKIKLIREKNLASKWRYSSL